ncbi:MAG: hypothetical protein JNJ53_15075 [Rhizobiales bacterium]|nr:hypothetical protein [Hyphomicrobiales bacterium]
MRSKHAPKFEKIVGFLCRVPAVEHNDTPSLGIGCGDHRSGGWSVTFSIDIDHRLAWYVVQAFGFVLNDLSLTERLPTVFKPVSPPPYMNGGPKEYLSWIIECSHSSTSPDLIAEWLESRLPQPVDDEAMWVEIDGGDAKVN